MFYVERAKFHEKLVRHCCRKNGNIVEATFDFVEATCDFVAFDNVCFDIVAGVNGV